MKRLCATAAVIGLAFTAVPLQAQNVNANNLVNVDISLENVANELAKNLSVDVSQIPVTVQVPVGVAATVCGVDANVLAQQKGDAPAECQATSVSQGLTEVVQRQIG